MDATKAKALKYIAEEKDMMGWLWRVVPTKEYGSQLKLQMAKSLLQAARETIETEPELVTAMTLPK